MGIDWLSGEENPFICWRRFIEENVDVTFEDFFPDPLDTKVYTFKEIFATVSLALGIDETHLRSLGGILISDTPIIRDDKELPFLFFVSEEEGEKKLSLRISSGEYQNPTTFLEPHELSKPPTTPHEMFIYFSAYTSYITCSKLKGEYRKGKEERRKIVEQAVLYSEHFLNEYRNVDRPAMC